MVTKYRKVTIAADGHGDYLSLSEAVKAVDPHQPIHFFVCSGLYNDRPFLELDDYILEGEGTDRTVFSANVGGKDPWPGEAKTGTFRSWALFLGGGKAQVRHLTVQNTAGDGALRGQGLAVYADASTVVMEDVELWGNQDTLFTAPLPLQVREPNGFRGPREDSPRLNTKQFYANCTIAGNIDFIFGGADAIFYRCNIMPLPHQNSCSYIAAPCTPQGQLGYLFANCKIGGQDDCPQASVYLARPWRKYARVFYLDCVMGPEIIPAGWDNWSNPENEQTVMFGEAGSTGPGASSSRSFGSINQESEVDIQRRRLAQALAIFTLKTS